MIAYVAYVIGITAALAAIVAGVLGARPWLVVALMVGGLAGFLCGAIDERAKLGAECVAKGGTLVKYTCFAKTAVIR